MLLIPRVALCALYHSDPLMRCKSIRIISASLKPSVQTLGLVLMLLCSCALTASAQKQPPADGSTEIVAVVNNQKITLKQVDDSVGMELQALQERISSLRRRALNSLITKTLLENEAKARGLTSEQLTKQLVPATIEVKQSQVDETYSMIANRFPSLSEEEAKQKIRMELENHAKFEAYQAALADLKKKAQVEILLREPAGLMVKVSDAGPTKGTPKAQVTIVEFSDFECPYCKQATSALKQILPEYSDKVKLVFKHLPLPNHQHAFQSAQAAVCAEEQGKFWEYHDLLFGNTVDLSTDTLKQHAVKLGLKAEQFNQCLTSESSRNAVMKDMQEAKQAGISGTPTFVMNGKLIRGAKSAEEFRTAIEQELKAQSPASRNNQAQVRREGQ